MLTEKELAELEEMVEVAMLSKHLRLGQAYMNCLFDVNPELYRTITLKEVADCFYLDSKIPAFLTYINSSIK